MSAANPEKSRNHGAGRCEKVLRSRVVTGIERPQQGGKGVAAEQHGFLQRAESSRLVFWAASLTVNDGPQS